MGSTWQWHRSAKPAGLASDPASELAAGLDATLADIFFECCTVVKCRRHQPRLTSCSVPPSQNQTLGQRVRAWEGPTAVHCCRGLGLGKELQFCKICMLVWHHVVGCDLITIAPQRERCKGTKSSQCIAGFGPSILCKYRVMGTCSTRRRWTSTSSTPKRRSGVVFDDLLHRPCDTPR